MVNLAAFCVYFIGIIFYLSLLSLSVGGVSAVLRYRRGDSFEDFMHRAKGSVKTAMYVFIVLGIFFFFVVWTGYDSLPLFQCPTPE